MGLFQKLFQVYVAIAIVRTIDRWFVSLLTRHVHHESETMSFSTINFSDCDGEHHRMCRNIVRSQKDLFTNAYSYQIEVLTFSQCRDVAYQFGIIGDPSGKVQWSHRAEPGGAFKVGPNGKIGDDPFYGSRKVFHMQESDYKSEFAIWFSKPLDNETLYRCKTHENDDPYLFWRYTLMVNSPLAEWTGWDWFNVLTVQH